MKFQIILCVALTMSACSTTKLKSTAESMRNTAGSVKDTAMDTPEAVIEAPVKALNLNKKYIPVFLRSPGNPYKGASDMTCKKIIAEVDKLTEFAGPDWDSDEHYTKRGRTASELVDSILPYGGLVRFVSGASEHEKKLAASLNYAIVRRAHLKAYGQERGCRLPGRPK